MKAFGILVVNKPIGPTSHKVVSAVRKGTGIRKVGHAGTLDPRASGVLVLCLGAATRLSEYLSTTSKRYEALVRFGASTQTYDSEGAVVRRTDETPSLEAIKEILPEFRGEISQVPPPYSAIKLGGRKAYELARSGEEFDLQPRPVTIYEIEIESYDPPHVRLSIECSAGTYVRSLAHDLGDRLGTGAHLAGLSRTKAGHFSLEDAVSLAELERSMLQGDWEQYSRPAADALPDLPIVEVEPEAEKRLRNGQRIPSQPGATGMARGVDQDGELIAILEAVEDGTLWHPRKVFMR